MRARSTLNFFLHISTPECAFTLKVIIAGSSDLRFECLFSMTLLCDCEWDSDTCARAAAGGHLEAGAYTRPLFIFFSLTP